jgi:hypothetical protein
LNQDATSVAHRPHANWEQQFEAMAAQEDDRLLDPPALTEWDRDEWKW